MPTMRGSMGGLERVYTERRRRVRDVQSLTDWRERLTVRLVKTGFAPYEVRIRLAVENANPAEKKQLLETHRTRCRQQGLAR